MSIHPSPDDPVYRNDDTKLPELLPCPFCGGHAAITDDRFAAIQCGACGIKFSAMACSSPTRDTVTAWNRRAGRAQVGPKCAECGGDGYFKAGGWRRVQGKDLCWVCAEKMKEPHHMPADHPTDPDAALVERVSRIVLDAVRCDVTPDQAARAAIAAMREGGVRIVCDDETGEPLAWVKRTKKDT